jgi:ABC-2 type transport system ATP-binding protein
MLRFVGALISALLLAMAAPAVAQTASHSAENATVTNPEDGTTIAITVFKPARASATQVPVILHSHGWGGSRSTSIGGEIASLLDAGFGVVSIDQRGHGASSGEANVQDPTKETEDIKAVIDHIAKLNWVLHDRNASKLPIANDPVLGAIGGSYGGGYQTMTALDEIADEGRTRLNAIAPEITWYDLNESLAPQEVVRTAWNTVLYAAGSSMLPQYVHTAFAWGASTGLWPDGTLYEQPAPGVVPDLDSEFHKHGPVHFAERGIKLNIPVLLRQGTSDNLFNLNQGLDIFHKALTDKARSQSYFVAFNGGHALPNVAPRGAPAEVALGGGKDACTGDWIQTRINFFRKAFAGNTAGVLPKRYNFTNLDASECMRFSRIGAHSFPVDPTGTGKVIATAALGAPLHLEVADGPLKVTGVPKLTGTYTSVGLDNRAFFGLAVGTNPADAQVLQNNLMPLRVVRPQTDRKFEIELPGVSAQIAEGQKLFLTVTPISDMYFGHGSRAPGGFLLSDVNLTVQEPAKPVATRLMLERRGTGETSRLVATLTEAQTGAPVSGVPIAFSTQGVGLGTKTTNASGVAGSLLTNPQHRKEGRVYSAVFTGTEGHQASSATATAPKNPIP